MSVGPAAGFHAGLLLQKPISIDPPVGSFGQAAVQDVLDVLDNQVNGNYSQRKRQEAHVTDCRH